MSKAHGGRTISYHTSGCFPLPPQDLQAAIAFIGQVHGQTHTLDILAVLEHLVGGGGGGAGSAAQPAQTSSVTSPSRGSPSVGLCVVAIAQGLLPAARSVAATSPKIQGSPTSVATSAPTVAADMMKRRLMPLLMVTLSRGDPQVQSTCVWALLEVLIRFSEDSKLVEQVCVIRQESVAQCGRVTCAQWHLYPVLKAGFKSRF